GFLSRDPEKLRVEEIYFVYKSPVSNTGLGMLIKFSVMIGIDKPALGRSFNYGILAIVKDAPELLWIAGAAGKAATHADDSYGLRGCALHCGQPGARFLKLNESSPQHVHFVNGF